MTERTRIRVGILTLGCKLNQTESMGMAEQLDNAGFKIVIPESGADIYIINTCTVTGKTDRRSRHAVRKVLQWNPRARIVVTGCGVQRDPEEFADLPNVRVVAGNREKMRILDLIRDMDDHRVIRAVEPMERAPFESIPVTRFGHYTRAFVKIQDGCSQSCTYCVIPGVRGPSRSREPDGIIDEMETLAAAGFREIVLTGIHLGLYGIDLQPQITLIELLDRIKKIKSLDRLRLSSLEPTRIVRDLIEYIIRQPHICRHLHIPLQSGCDAILTRMRRPYRTARFQALISGIKRCQPDFCIGTDVIVGFPGETESCFEETYRFIESNPFDYLHVFTFSPRRGTEAAALPGRIDPETARRRCHALRSLSRGKAEKFRKSFEGRDLPVIILAGRDKSTGLPVGLSDNYIRVLLRGPVPDAGSIVAARVETAAGLQTFGSVA